MKRQQGRYLDSSSSQNPSHGFHPASPVGIVELGLLLGHGGLSGFSEKHTQHLLIRVCPPPSAGGSMGIHDRGTGNRLIFTAFSFSPRSLKPSTILKTLKQNKTPRLSYGLYDFLFGSWEAGPLVAKTPVLTSYCTDSNRLIL